MLENHNFESYEDTYSVTYEHFQNCSRLFLSATERRRHLTALFCGLAAFYIPLSFAADSFPLFAALVSATYGIMLVVDSVCGDISAYRSYDFLCSGAADMSGARAASGLAHICAWDYSPELGGFRHDEYYRTASYSADCIRHIFNEVAVSSKHAWTALTAFIIALSSVAAAAEIVQLLLPELRYFRFTDTSALYYTVMILLLLSGIVNIFTLLESGAHYRKIAEYEYYAGKSGVESASLSAIFRKGLYSGHISDLDISRGVYNYNFCRFEHGESVESIQPPDDRYHLMYICRRKLQLMTSFFVYFIIAYFSIAVWHTGRLQNAWSILVFLAAYVIWTFVLYPPIKRAHVRKLIRRYCEPDE